MSSCKWKHCIKSLKTQVFDIIPILFLSVQKQGREGSVNRFETGLNSSLYHTEAFIWKYFNATKLHLQAKKAKVAAEQSCLGETSTYVSLSESPVITQVTTCYCSSGTAEGFSPFLCPSPLFPVCLSSSNTCFSPSLLSHWPNFPLALKVTHTRCWSESGRESQRQCKQMGGKKVEQIRAFAW